VFSESSAAADLHTGRTPALRPDVSAPDRCALPVPFRASQVDCLGRGLQVRGLMRRSRYRWVRRRSPAWRSPAGRTRSPGTR